MEIKVLKSQDRKGHVSDVWIDRMEFTVDGELVMIGVNGVLMWVKASDLKEYIKQMEV